MEPTNAPDEETKKKLDALLQLTEPWDANDTDLFLQGAGVLGIAEYDNPAVERYVEEKLRQGKVPPMDPPAALDETTKERLDVMVEMANPWDGLEPSLVEQVARALGVTNEDQKEAVERHVAARLKERWANEYTVVAYRGGIPDLSGEIVPSGDEARWLSKQLAEGMPKGATSDEHGRAMWWFARRGDKSGSDLPRLSAGPGWPCPVRGHPPSEV